MAGFIPYSSVYLFSQNSHIYALIQALVVPTIALDISDLLFIIVRIEEAQKISVLLAKIMLYNLVTVLQYIRRPCNNILKKGTTHANHWMAKLVVDSGQMQR